jgi:CcmD family protein
MLRSSIPSTRRRLSVSNEWDFVIAAYSVTWVVLIGYAVYVSRRWGRAQQEASGPR